MKVNILLTAMIFLALALQSKAESTVLTYIVEKEINQEDHYVELTLKIQVDGPSLKQAIDSAASVIANIKKAVISDCQKSATDKKAKKECKDMVQDSKYEVEPKYHLVRKVPTFTLFILTHEVTIKLKNIKGLGKLTDQIQQLGQDLATLKEFVWKADEEIDSEVSTLKDGLKQGRELCKKIGKTLTEVISVEQLQIPEKEEDQQQQKDEDIMEQEVETTALKFKVRCEEKEKKTKSQGKKK